MTRKRQSSAMPHVQRTFFAQEPLEAASCHDISEKPKKPKPPATPRRLAPPKIQRWLTQLTQIHAHVRYIVRIFAHPEIAGGQSLEGDTYAARAERFDQTLIHDAAMKIRDDADGIVTEVQAEMDAAQPTRALPGTVAKVAEMEARAMRGQSIFIDKDAKIPL